MNPASTKNDAAPRSAVGASASHTPGPWRQYTLTVCALNRLGENKFAAHVSPGHKDNGDWIAREELLANARLIAAAPDLLAALENYLVTWENEGKKPGWCARVSAAKEQCHAAIKKAKGQ